MTDLASAAVSQMASFIADNSELWAIPVGVCAVGLVLSVVVSAIRNK